MFSAVSSNRFRKGDDVLFIPLAFALAFPHAEGAAAPLPLKVALRHLEIGGLGGNDDGDPNWKPNSGTPYLTVCEERCHDAFLELLDGIESGRYKPHADVNISSLFSALVRQKSDRSRFLKYAERYALKDRKENKVDEYTQRDAIQLLGQIGSDTHVEGLLKLMKDPDRQIRKTALRAIGVLGDSRHVPELTNLNNDPVEDHPILRDVDRRLITDTAEALSKKPIPESALKAEPPGKK
jgi:HEAT repeats